MFRLLVTREVDSATIPIDWCISSDTFQKIKDKNIHNPHVLIVVRPKDGAKRNEMRYLVPIEDARQYIVLRKPGINIVFAILVWTTKGLSASTLRDRYLGRDLSSYVTDVINGDGNGLMPALLDENPYFGVADFTHVELDVPESLFAQEPSARLSWWVNLWHKTRPRDECEFGKRKGIAFTIKPVLVLAYVTFLFLVRFVVALFWLSCGRKGLRFSPIVHPFKHSTDSVYLSAEGTIFSWSTKKDKPVFFLLPLAPVCLLTICTIVYFVASHYGHDAWWMVSRIFFTVVVLLCTFIALNVGFALIDSYIGSEAQKEARDQKKKRRLAEALEERLARQEKLVCDSPDFSKRLTSLGPRQRIRLLYWEIKGAVCRPFAS